MNVSAMAEFPSTHLHISTNKKTRLATAEMLIRHWPELKNRWQTQTQKQVNKNHETHNS